jgi:C-terminal processing protease CtpA/Prc
MSTRKEAYTPKQAPSSAKAQVLDVRRHADGSWSARVKVNAEILLPDGRTVHVRRRFNAKGRMTGRRRRVVSLSCD